MSTRVATLPMIARPKVSRAPSARRYRGSSNCRSFSLMNMLLKIMSTFRRCMWALFPQGALHAACLPVGLAVGLAARCLAQKRYRLCAGVPSSAVRTRWDSRTELSIMMKFTKPRSTSLELA